jgi:5-methyltetrahydropteroyltriglutamate--homocysteine methyltransferase
MAAFASEVIGSLLRPPYLRAARAAHERGDIGAAQFKAIEDRAVNEAIAIQCQAGLDVITDGEMRRYAFYGHLIDCVEGFDKFGGWAIPFRDDQGGKVLLNRPVVVGRLKRQRHLCAEEFAYLRGRTDHPVKVTLISAQQAAAYYDPGEVARRLCGDRRLPRRRGDYPAPGSGGVGPARLRLHTSRCAAICRLNGPRDSRRLSPARQ